MEREINREKERDRKSERDKGDFDSSHSPGKDNISMEVSVFQKDIRHNGQTSTLVPDNSLLLGLTHENCALQSVLHGERQG